MRCVTVSKHQVRGATFWVVKILDGLQEVVSEMTYEDPVPYLEATGWLLDHQWPREPVLGGGTCQSWRYRQLSQVN
jgi:hypothetical protein